MTKRSDDTLDERSPAPREEGELPVTPEVHGRYVVRGEQGRGGQSVILLAHDRHIGRDIAIKELLPKRTPGLGGPPAGTPAHPDSQRASTLVRRFLREARITGQLEHPSIVPVHEVGQHPDGRHYYTQKLVRGRTLQQALAACDGLAARLKLLSHFADICQAVAYAHDRGVIHRDLKPANVMVGEFGETVVVDWGLAKARGSQKGPDALEIPAADGPGKTLEGTVMGTPSYMSPEQAAGKVDEIDERSDVFSLGIILFEILTGQLPFRGETSGQVLFKVSSGVFSPVREVCPEAPAELAAVAERALARDRALRYPTARALAAEIDAYQSGTRVTAYEYSSVELARRFVRKNPALTAVSAAALCLVIALLGKFYRDDKVSRDRLAQTLVWRGQAADAEQQWGRATAYYAAARLQSDRLDARWGLAIDRPRAPLPALTLRVPLPGALAVSSDGALVAAASNVQLQVRDARSGALQAQAEVGRRIEDLAFSPDGAVLAAASIEGGLQLFASKGLESLGRLPGTGGFNSVSFSPDGRAVVASSEDGTLSTFDLATRALRSRSRAAPSVGRVLHSPDGKLLAATGSDRAIHLIDVASGKPAGTLEGHEADVVAIAFSPDGRLLASTGADRTGRLWDVATRKPVARLDLGAAATNVLAIAFSPDGRTLATQGPDNSVLLWDVPGRQRLVRIDGDTDLVDALVFAPDGRLFTSADDGLVRAWDVKQSLTALAALPEPSAPASPPHSAAEPLGEVRGLAFSPDGTMFASGGPDQRVTLRDATTFAPVGQIPIGSGVQELAFAARTGTLVVAEEGGAISLWDLPGRTPRARFGQGSAPTNSLAVAPDASTVASTTNDFTLRIWDVGKGTVTSTQPTFGWTLGFSPDGSAVLAAVKRALGFLDPRTGKELRRFPTGSTPRGIAVNRDGKRFAFGQPASELVIGDFATGALLRRMTGPAGLQTLAFSPDGRLLVAAGATVDVFEAGTGMLLTRRSGPEGFVGRLSISTDGRRLATASVAGGVRVLPLDGVRELASPERDLAAVLAATCLRLDGVTLLDDLSCAH